jgi:HSP20 family protein
MIKIRFSEGLGGIDSEFRRSFDEMFRLLNSTFAVYQNVWRPQVDIYESPDEIMILVDIAGARREDLFLEIDQRVLRIYGKREKPVTGNTKYHLALKENLPFPIPLIPIRLKQRIRMGFCKSG